MIEATKAMLDNRFPLFDSVVAGEVSESIDLSVVHYPCFSGGTLKSSPLLR